MYIWKNAALNEKCRQHNSNWISICYSTKWQRLNCKGTKPWYNILVAITSSDN